MGDILAFKRRKASEKHAKKILCKSNFHKWQVVQENQFDVKQGRLLTRYVCSRCGATRVEAK